MLTIRIFDPRPHIRQQLEAMPVFRAEEAIRHSAIEVARRAALRPFEEANQSLKRAVSRQPMSVALSRALSLRLPQENLLRALHPRLLKIGQLLKPYRRPLGRDSEGESRSGRPLGI